IPNRTVKRLCADDSAATSVKVGYRQASYMKNPTSDLVGFFALGGRYSSVNSSSGRFTTRRNSAPAQGGASFDLSVHL
ncbi:MAG: hypothetical protein AB1437_19600, partial [Pseudomonadota bacterium]